jgi:hypothetical protein
MRLLRRRGRRSLRARDSHASTMLASCADGGSSTAPAAGSPVVGDLTNYYTAHCPPWLPRLPTPSTARGRHTARRITEIQERTDAPIADSTWQSLWNGPNFPSCVSDHSAFSAAAAAALEGFSETTRCRLPLRRSKRRVSAERPGFINPADATERFDSFTDIPDTAGLSRIYGGIHDRRLAPCLASASPSPALPCCANDHVGAPKPAFLHKIGTTVRFDRDASPAKTFPAGIAARRSATFDYDSACPPCASPLKLVRKPRCSQAATGSIVSPLSHEGRFPLTASDPLDYFRRRIDRVDDLPNLLGRRVSANAHLHSGA